MKIPKMLIPLVTIGLLFGTASPGNAAVKTTISAVKKVTPPIDTTTTVSKSTTKAKSHTMKDIICGGLIGATSLLSLGGPLALISIGASLVGGELIYKECR